MRYQEITEAIASDAMRAKTYYHGTPHEDKGVNILRTGLMPGNETVKRGGLMTPVMGRTYLTDDLRYAIIYCIGGDMLGCSEDSVKSLMRSDRSQHGYLFSVSGQHLAEDVQPDEDSIGIALSIIDYWMRKKQDYHNDTFSKNLIASNQSSRFFHFAKGIIAPSRFAKCCDGEAAYQAAVGKTLLRKMPDWMKIWLIHCGAHVAYQGPIMPDGAWRFDKLLTPQLEKDGSNFFALAEKVI